MQLLLLAAICTGSQAQAQAQAIKPGAMSQEKQTSAARLAAIRQCCIEAAKFSTSAWQTTQLATYRTCMAEHGQWFE
jgi:hypothetical protein